MKTTASILLGLATTALSAPATEKRDTVKGFDVSHYQPTIDWSGAYSSGMRFVYIKATESTDYIDPKFSDHYDDATKAGFIRGAYHFADGSASATAQAQYFHTHGGGWSNDGITLPGMLDLEGDCISVSWIQEFVNEYHSLSGRWAVLYSSPSWWESCTGNSKAFTSNNPLMMACWDSSPCTPQGDWPYWTIWQYKDSNPYGGDSDEFNGSLTQLKKLATG